MKKLLFLAVLLLGVQSAHAIPTIINFDEYRTTSPAGGWTNFIVATGSVKLFSVTVASGNPSSSFIFKNGTSAVTIQSTSPYYDTSTSGDSFLINKTLPKGFMFTSTGTSVLQIDWDWEFHLPKGQENKGKY